MNKLFAWVRAQEPVARPHKTVNLALQGGGAHGAFTWGVLDHLLEDGRIAIDGVSGASAGALNAVMLADGLHRGGPEEARKRLAEFWRAASVDGGHSGLPPAALLAGAMARASMKSWADSMGRFLSPGQLNPLDINPLRQTIERLVDFEALRASGRDLFVAATDARSGELRLFTTPELSADVVMASAALPTLFRAVDIEGVAYWDGGYSANPPLLPFLETQGSADVLLVQIFPLQRPGLPGSVREIAGRAGEFAFNAPLQAELRALAAFDRAATGRGPRRLRLHRIALDDSQMPDDPASRLNNHYRFFQDMHALGRDAARQFLLAHFDRIGTCSTIDAAEEAGSDHGSA